MVEFRKKRSDERRPCRLEARCAPFIRSVFYGADVLNVSDGGMYFETKLPVKPGVAMLILEIQPPAGAKATACACGDFRSMAVGEVTRCNQLTNPDGRLTYGIGLKFIHPQV
jgi:hypothetical protein